MPLKPKPSRKGIPVARTHRLDTTTGKLVPIKKKLSRPAEYAKAKRQKWRAAK